MRCRARYASNRREELLDLRFRQMAGDEDEAGAAVVVGPVLELDRAVRDMLVARIKERFALSTSGNE